MTTTQKTREGWATVPCCHCHAPVEVPQRYAHETDRPCVNCENGAMFRAEAR